MTTHVHTVLKRSVRPDELRDSPLFRFEVVPWGGPTIGGATYQPGWRSEHVGRSLGTRFCSVEHVGLVHSGCASTECEHASATEMKTDDPFHVPGVPHAGPGHCAQCQ